MNCWLIVTIEGEPYWHSQESQIEFNGRTFFLRPLEGECAPDVRTQFHHRNEVDELAAFNAICAFLSNLSWWQRRPIRAALRILCTAPMRGGMRRPMPSTWDGFHISESMKIPSNEKAKRAIAIYREAMSLDNTPYEFLGYMKIINVLHNKSDDQIRWINSTHGLLTDKIVQTRISDVVAEYPNIGQYLYGLGRCAVAHAYGNDAVNPDNSEDVFRLARDTPIVRALAEYLIEHELHVPWSERQLG